MLPKCYPITRQTDKLVPRALMFQVRDKLGGLCGIGWGVELAGEWKGQGASQQGLEGSDHSEG